MHSLNRLDAIIRGGTQRLLALSVIWALANSAFGQTPATLTDLGTTAPTPGPADLYQFESGATASPDGLNYYDDNQSSHGAGEPGQTFTTGATSGGYELVSVAIATGGGTSSGTGTAQDYLLHIYSMNGSTATLLATLTATNFSFNDGDWLRWSGFAITLAPNMTYAYSFGRTTTGTGWDALQTAGNFPFTGGQLGLFPPAGGTVTFGSSGSYSGTFDLGLLTSGPPTAATPVISPTNNVYAGTDVSLTENAVVVGSLSYQWRTNGAAIPGATNNPLTLLGVTTTNSGSYSVVVANGFGSSTSSPVILTVLPSSTPHFTQQPAPAVATLYVGGFAEISAVAAGSPPIAYQWFRNGTPVAGGSGPTLALGNLQTNESGAYTLAASNRFGAVTSSPSTLNVLITPAPQPVLTYHYDNTREGANTNEYILNPATLNVGTFGQLFNYTVDGHVCAAPLYVPNLTIPGQGTFNVIFIATEHDSVYAFNADTNTGPNGGLIWFTNLGISAATPDPNFGSRYGAYHDVNPEVGITSTPVIDPVAGTIYLDVFTHEGSSYIHRIHALNITNGTERSFSPVVVGGSVPGKGVGGNGSTITFSAIQHLQRPALTLANGTLFVPYSSYADTDPYHGWVFARNASTLQVEANGIFNTTPNATVATFGVNAGEGGLWMGGNGVSVDSSNNIYFQTGNGSFSANTNGGDYADTIVKLSTTNGLAVADYFTPSDQASLAAGDVDLGSGGPMLLPDSMGSAAHPHLLVGCGKEGTIYLVDRDNMGKYNVNNDSQIVQELGGAVGGLWSSGAYWNHLIYYQGSGDVMKAFAVTNAHFNNTSPVTQSGDNFGFPGATPVISALGASNGIAWDTESDQYGSGPAVLHAYNATNLSKELYNSSQNPDRDNPGIAVKMTTPTVINGKVYVGASYEVSVYGYGLFTEAPGISPPGAVFTGSILVTLSEATPGASIYYTLDGSAPTTNSTLYTGPFVLTQSASVQAIAAAPGAVTSGTATAGFVNSSSLGTGTGLTGEYFADHTSAQGFSGTPTLVRVDPEIDFNWDNAGPSTAVGQTVFTVRWTGCVQPQFSEIYTFSVTADDGTRLFVNGQELVNAWQDQAPTTYTGSIPLEAQQLYNIEMDYYQNGGGAVADLGWSSPSTPSGIIPQTQLYPYTNPPPTATITSPTNGATFEAPATVTIVADADAPYNPISYVNFYVDGAVVGTVSNAPYTLTVTGLAAGSHNLLAKAVDGSGLSSVGTNTSISVSSGSGLAYGVASRPLAPAFFNMPEVFTGDLPLTLSATGVFSNTPEMAPTNSLIAYAPIAPLWSDGAVKTRYLSIPNSGGPNTPGQQIGFAPTGEWTFPSGTVFVKTFQLVTNLSEPTALRRLETRLLVRDTNGGVYGVTYKWRPDYSDADLLTGSLTEPIPTTTATGVVTQNWYYPSPADCLTCHNAAANYVLGVKTRQLNTSFAYPSGLTDNELRTLNGIGLFNPAFSMASIDTFSNLFSLTNAGASLVSRARSYIDANCAQCHRPGGSGGTFDARYDTPLTNQNIINAPVLANLGYDNAAVVVPNDILRSMMYDRMNTVTTAVKMPPLARNTIDSNAVAVMAAWIESLPGTPTVAPPSILPAGGIFTNSVSVALQPPDGVASLYYTLDGSLPTTNSTPYYAPFTISASGTVRANAFESGYVNSVATTATFTIVPPLYNLFAPELLGNGSFQFQYWAPPGTYVLQGTTDLVNWVSVSTNTPSASPFFLLDPGAGASPYKFYRVQQQ